MMALVNIAGVKGPTAPMKLPVTLRDIGLNTVELLNSDAANPQHLHPDDLHATSVDNNIPRWWLAMTIEEHASVKPTDMAEEPANTVMQTLSGSQHMPKVDKLILASSPQLVITTMYMHATETMWLRRAQRSGCWWHGLRTCKAASPRRQPSHQHVQSRILVSTTTDRMWTQPSIHRIRTSN